MERTTDPLDLIHTDICDLKAIPTRSGNKYFITFIDDSTRFCYVYLLKSKDEAIDKFVMFKAEVENQLNRKIKKVRSDRGGEYVSPFADLCAKSGIIHELTAPYSPQSNGMAERKNRTLKEMMNAMLISSGMSEDMWGDALLSANFVQNLIPRKGKDKTPYELWTGIKPSYKRLRVWGCLAKVVVTPPKRLLIGPKTVDCVFIGYTRLDGPLRFLVYDSKNPGVYNGTILESKDASWFEHIFPCLGRSKPGSADPFDESAINDEPGPSKPVEDNSPIEEVASDEPQIDEGEIRRSKRQRTEKSFGPDFLTYMVDEEPQTYHQAVNSSDGPQ